MPQEVERAAGPAECFIAWHRSRLGGEGVHFNSFIAEAGGKFGLVVRVAAVEAAVNLSQFVVSVADLEIAPHSVILATARSDEELAHGGRHFFHYTIVAERRVVIVGIDAPE